MKNLLLNQLSQGDFKLLEPYLKVVLFKQHTILFEAEHEIERVYFPSGGVVSLVVTLETGEMVEAAMVGSDGVVGASAALDGPISLSRGIVQLGGDIVICSIDGLKSAALKSPTLLSLLIRHEQTVYAQAQQSAACFATHHIQARLCRWLLRARDLAGTDTLNFHARIPGGNARGSADNCDSRGAQPSGCWSNQVCPGENPDRRCGSTARWRV
jgi:CRP-like cAMP-binding protein